MLQLHEQPSGSTRWIDDPQGEAPEPGQSRHADDGSLSKFRGARSSETCFHDRHIGAQIYAGLDGGNWRWRLHEAVMRGDGYQALNARIAGNEAGMTPDQVIAEVKAESGFARPRRRGLSRPA